MEQILNKAIKTSSHINYWKMEIIKEIKNKIKNNIEINFNESKINKILYNKHKIILIKLFMIFDKYY